MNLRQLRYFLAVAESLHFGRAAQQLNMAQPPLSMQIKQLEKDLGVVLFERTKRRVCLTPAGKVLQVEAQLIFQQLDLTREKVRQAANGEIGHLSIGFVSSGMYSLLPIWLKQFRQTYSAVELSLYEIAKAQQIERLLLGQLDIGLARPPIENPQISSRLVLREGWVAVLPEGHPLSKSEKIAIADLSKQRFVFFSRYLATDLYDKIIEFCRRHGFSPDIAQTAEQLQTLLGLVAAQMGIAIFPAAVQKLQREGVCYRPFIDPTPTADLMLIWRRDNLSETAQNFFNNAVSLE